MGMTYKERMFAALGGEMPDVVPFVPRIDLWHTACAVRGTLPKAHADKTPDEICRAEGWAIYKLTSNYVAIVDDPWHTVLTSLGIFISPDTAFSVTFSPDIEVDFGKDGNTWHVSFHTAEGSVAAAMEYPEEMRRNGITYPWVKERLIKTFDDWKIVARIFDHMILVPEYARYNHLVGTIGSDSVVTSAASDPSSPMHHIQKYFFEGTDFFLLYKERYAELSRFAASISRYYEQVIDLLADSPVELVSWGGNYDATITYPPYFEKEIFPWLKRAADTLHARGIPVITHCDGENDGLMELIRDSGVDGAESICPFPMTRLKLHEYYERWADRLTIIGGIPAEYLIKEMASDETFEGYLDYLMKAVAPGRRYIGGITDAVPADADFDRLRRVHDFFERNGRTPLVQGAIPEFFKEDKAQKGCKKQETVDPDGKYRTVREIIFKGDKDAMAAAVEALLAQGRDAGEILQKGMIASMDVIGDRFSTGEVFIPEMLMAAQAMEAGVSVLKKSLLSTFDKSGGSGIVVIGTVSGDLHDIGKNLVAIMMRGVGFTVVDLGTNVSSDQFLNCVREEKPVAVALSALLTTTMPEMGRVIDTLKEAGLRDSLKVIIGGAPVTAQFADTIGADGYAENAGGAAALIKDLLAEL